MTDTEVPRSGSSPQAASSSPYLSRLAITITGIFIIWKLVFLLFFTINTRYVMDEYIQASYSLLIPDGFYKHVDPIKTVLYIYYFDLARLLAGNANQLMRYARLEALVLAVGMIVLCGLAARRLWGTTLATVWAVAILLSFSNFIEHSFRIRSDTLAAFFSIAALIPLLSDELNWRRPFAAGVLIGLAFISTQKAAYAAVAIGLAILVHSGSLLVRLQRGFIYTGGFLAVLMLYAVYFGDTDVIRVFRMIAFGPMPLATSGSAYFGSLRSFEWRSLQQNPVAYTICAVGIGMSVRGWRNARPAERAALVATVFITAAFFLHNQAWPYVFVHCLPFLSLFGPRVLTIERAVRPGFVALVALALLSPTLARNIHYTQFDNAQQELTVAQAEAQLAPADRYQDGIGMVPTRHPAVFLWWDSMNGHQLLHAVSVGDRSELLAIARGQPKLWIFSYRIGALWSVLRPLIADSYVRVFPNVFLTGTMVRPGQAIRFANYWSGEYRLYSADGKPRDSALEIDGVKAALPVSVPAGIHEVLLTGPGAEDLFLLPADASLNDFNRLPPPFDLFANVYD